MRMLAAALILLSGTPLLAQNAQPADAPPTSGRTSAASSAPAPVYGKPVTAEINPGKMISYPFEGRDIPAYLVTPKVSGPTPTVIVAHDIFGMTDWVKEQAEHLGRQGYTVIVPNLYSRLPGTEKGVNAQQAWLDYDQTSDQQMMGDLKAAIEFVQAEGKPTANQPVGIVGYDMGGIYAMMLAGTDLRVTAAVNYYGRVLYHNTSRNRPMSPVESLFNIQAPLLSFYGSVDPQVPDDQVRALESRLSHNPNQTYYEVVRLPGVGHGFLVPTRPGYNATAAKQAEEKTREFLARYLRAAPKKEEE